MKLWEGNVFSQCMCVYVSVCLSVHRGSPYDHYHDVIGQSQVTWTCSNLFHRWNPPPQPQPQPCTPTHIRIPTPPPVTHIGTPIDMVDLVHCIAQTSGGKLAFGIRLKCFLVTYYICGETLFADISVSLKICFE